MWHAKPLSFFVREAAGIALLGGAVAIVACTSLTGSSAASSVVTTYAPLTTIEVDANALFERIGCGTSAGQAFKYVVVAWQAGPGGLRTQPNATAVTVTDCYTDALFQNLQNSQLFGANAYFSLDVYVFDQPTYDLVGTAFHRDANGNDAVSTEDFPVDDAGLATGAIATSALWRTTCFAKQIPNVEALAACDALHD